MNQDKNRAGDDRRIEDHESPESDSETSELVDKAVLDPHTLDARRLAADASLPLHERLEAFEDILESEVGDTTMTRARNIERAMDFRQLHLKFEGNNPTGTHKDRIAFVQVADALRRGYETVSAATCGNYGSAIALACNMAGVGCRIYIPEHSRSKRISEMEQYGASILRVAGDYEAAVLHSSKEAERVGSYDANPGGVNTPLQLKAYGEIAYEIYDELRDAPAAVGAPLSNGTLLAGLFRGFQSLFRRGKTSRMPRLVGGSSKGQNPIVHGFRSGAIECPTLPPEVLHETEVNEPLINWYSIDGDLALEALRQSSGDAADVSDRALQKWASELKKSEGLSVLPAATAGLAALLDLHRRSPLPSDRYVAVLTARR